MQLLLGSRLAPAPVSAFAKGSVATIGNFDGVHLGHQALLSQLKKQAIHNNQPLVVILFEPQPGEYFRGEQAPARVSSLREKLKMLQVCQVDFVYCLRFNRALATMPAITFAQTYFFSLLRASYLLIGEDFCFGRNREGDVSLLRTLARDASCQVETFPDVRMHETRISSTKIREALAQGDMKEAARLLGRPYYMCGRVVPGNGRGREWGIPTANLAMRRVSLPLKGVFCVRVQLPCGSFVNGVANLGRRPTLDGSKNVLEIHLFDFNQTIYGDLLQVSFLHKLRDEVKFSSLEALIAQIRDDVTVAKNWFDVTV